MATNISNPDVAVDATLVECLNPSAPKSFVLFAGAGSGKTRTLVNVLNEVKAKYGKTMLLTGKRVGVITYTNAACDEIQRRVGFDPLFNIATIHSFMWELMNPFQEDIRIWLNKVIKNDIEEYDVALGKSKSPTTKTYKELERKKLNAERRLANLGKIIKFTYNPNGTNSSRDSLSHSEVIKFSAYMLKETFLGKNVFAQKFPILLIDESQDTNKDLVDSFLFVQEKLPESFSLGLIGDGMQRIYFDGKHNLGQVLPQSWISQTKVMNYRCPKRIVSMINLIRKDVDGIEQIPKTDAIEGVVRLFIIPSVDNIKKTKIEEAIRLRMAEIAQDKGWMDNEKGVKCLTLEHHMAANRIGFLSFYEPLAKIDNLKTGLLDGSIPAIRLLSQCVLPLYLAFKNNDNFEIARVAKEYCPLISRKNIAGSKAQMELLRNVENRINNFKKLWDHEKDPPVIDILRSISEQELFEIPEGIVSVIAGIDSEAAKIDEETHSESEAWELALSVPFSTVQKYLSYISDTSSYGTHQGVKGLEFERVMVIIDDSEAKGFMFSYDKLFGIKEQSKTDLENRAEGKETGIDRTKRLFYVVCSRAMNSLAIVAYTSDSKTLKNNVIANGWCLEDEIIEMAVND